MGVPAEIRAVPRPKNTVVVAYGKNMDKYAVRERTGCRNDKGRRVPIEGGIIGHIVNGEYVPVEIDGHIPETEIDIKDFANVALCDHLMKDILATLRKVYCEEESEQIYCICILRACYPGIKDYQIESCYMNSFLSEMYPGVPLSKNTVCTLLRKLGQAGNRIRMFLDQRIIDMRSKIALVDGTLVSDESNVNTFSNYSRKARLKKSRDISVIYAFDLERMEPICYKAYAGNMIDSRAFKDFIRENHLKDAVIIADKGFPPNSARAEFQKNPDLHYLIALKNNLAALKHCNALDMDMLLSGEDGITCGKDWCAALGSWVYAFRDADVAASQERAYLATVGENYDPDVLREKREMFGVIVLESDLDMDPLLAYRAYKERWIIEEAFRMYKDIEDLDETRVHSDYSAMGTQFVNYLSTVLSCRLVKHFGTVSELDTVPYKQVLRLLRLGQKAKDAEGEWRPRRLCKKEAELLVKLGVFEKPIVPKRPRGRPRKSS